MGRALKDHDAADSMAGYLAQIDYAIWQLCNPDCKLVGIEVHDDVHCVLIDETVSLHQLKHSVAGRGKALTLKSVGLWKTLAIWVESTNLADVYVLAAPAFGKHWEIHDLQAASPDLSTAANKLADRLLAAAQTASSTIAPFAKVVQEAGRDRLLAVLSKLKLDPQTHRTLSALRARLGVPGDIIATNVLDDLRGRIHSAFTARTASRLPTQLQRDSFCKWLHESVRRHDGKQRRTRSRREVGNEIDVSSVNQSALFLHQLRAIHSPEEDLTEAATEFLHYHIERVRLNGEMTTTEDIWLAHEDSQYKSWNPTFKLMTMAIDGAITPETRGFKFYLQTRSTPTLHPEGVQICSSVYMGGLHNLADSIKIGWHPDFLSKFGTK